MALRKEDAELDATLDKLPNETEVRKHVKDFNERVIAARYRLPEGPPLVTMPRDVDEAVAAWTERRAARLAEQRAKVRAARAEQRRGAPAQEAALVAALAVSLRARAAGAAAGPPHSWPMPTDRRPS